MVCENKMADRFSFEAFSRELPPPAVAVLREDGFDNLQSLLSANASDIEGLQLKRGQVAVVREAVKRLQEKHREGPLYTTASREPKQNIGPTVDRKTTSEKPRSPATEKTSPPKAELRVVLIGKTGSGKSALGNTLLGREAFKSEASMSSSTQKCQWEEGSIDGTFLSVTDTPGLADTSRPDKEVLPEVTKSVSLACPGPHVVIMVIRCDIRFTKEEFQTVKTLREMFEKDLRRFLMVVFTAGDTLKVTLDRMQWALQQRLAGAPDTMKEVLNDVGTAYCVVDNTASVNERKSYARDVLCMIQALHTKNNGDYLTNKMMNKYNEIVQSAVDRRVKIDHMSPEEALRETRKAIAEEKEEPGIFQKLLNVSRDYILPVVSTAANVAIAGRVLGSAGCKIM